MDHPIVDLIVRNRLLASLSPAGREALLKRAEPVRLNTKEIVYEQHAPLEAAYFPLTGAFSMVSVHEDGDIIEVGTISNERMVGLPLFLGGDQIPLRVFSQIPGDSLKVIKAQFRRALQDDHDLYRVMNHYTQAVFNQLAQQAACNAIHSIEERCARWLLLTQDRVGTDEFILTHEFLSQMLGVRRASVTVVMGTFQMAGYVRYRQGSVTILDRQGLEEVSCEHSRKMCEEYDRLLPRVHDS